MSFIVTIIALLIITLLADVEYGLLLVLPFAAIIFLYLKMQKISQHQQREIQQLKTELDSINTRLAETESERVIVEQSGETAPPVQASPMMSETVIVVDQTPQPPPVTDDNSSWEKTEQSPGAVEKLFARARDLVWGYFTDGNVFVRVGLLILFFGVAFLLKYAAENSRIPIEFRFLGAAAGGLALLVFGWRLRVKKTVYGLLLQGGGIGIIYMTIFAAYQLANLLPSMLTFLLLVLFSMFTVALAVIQNSRALVIFAVVGGFLAPILASSGSGNYIGLFSYYTLLNAVIFAVAWYKTWRLLNLIGFVFTFLVYILWFVFSYQVHMLWPAMAFLLLFFVMYSLIGVFYALKQPHQLKGLVDGTLVFGTPVIVSSLLMAMLRHFDYGIACASACMGLYYVILARLLWQRSGDMLRLISEAMLAIGVVFATIAIPYSLDGHWSSATWALEAAGILWVSIRQHRLFAQWFAILVQAGAGILFLLTNADDLGSSIWVNPAFLGGFFIALGAFISSRMLYQLAAELKMRLLHLPFYIWAMGWWLFSTLIQIEHYIEEPMVAILILFTGTATVLVYFDRIRNWQWMPASITAVLLLPVLILLALVSIFENHHVFILPDLFFWIAVFVACYRIIVLLETVDWPNSVNLVAHTLYLVFLACLLSFELTWYLQDTLSAIGDAYFAVVTIMPLIFIHAAQTERVPAIRRFGEVLQFSIIASLSVILALWSLGVNFTNSGNVSPLPYIPFLNPIDIAHIAWFVLMIRNLKLFQKYGSELGRLTLIAFACLAFIWITAVLIRTMHHLLEISFDLSALSMDSRVQTAISILWTLIGMAAMLLASKRSVRTVWIVGASLIGVVLVKMFFIDLGASGTVERIVSFMVVGSLLVAMGYFSPIPKKQEPDDAAEDIDNG